MGSVVGNLELTGVRIVLVRPSSKLVNDDCLSTYIAVGGVMGGPTAPVVVPKILVLRWGWWRFSESSKKKKKKKIKKIKKKRAYLESTAKGKNLQSPTKLVRQH